MRRTVILALLATGSLLVALPLDHDGDGLVTVQEWGQGSSALQADSDRDGLPDGFEARNGLDPTRADTDGDALPDGQEWRLGTDGRIADMDQDGVLDGHEGNVACVRSVDCDGDGLEDGLEQEGPFDALDADSFDVGLSDAVVRAFDEAGQEADQDRDLDGIPDAWETSDGLMAWGAFDPQPGRRDLLIEFLKVSGPHSGRFTLDMHPAYDAVAAMFAAHDVHIQWIETEIALPQEHRPGFLDGQDLDHYRTVLDAGQASDHPYVTTIVLQPQQEQEDLGGNVLGAAFLRSMIATVDYGSHVEVVFEEASSDGLGLTGDGQVRLSPSIESHILGAPREQLRQIRFASEGIVDLGTTADGVFMVTRQGGDDFRWTWRNDWFATAPNITLQDGAWLQLRAVDAVLYDGTLAQTIAHELGHTLGLCHAHEADCVAQYAPEDRLAARGSTMSYLAAPGTLQFVPSEWAQVQAYVTCPPQGPVRLVAEGATRQTILEAKYESSFTQAQSVRACGASATLARDLDPAPLGAAQRNGAPWLALHVALTAILGATWIRFNR